MNTLTEMKSISQETKVEKMKQISNQRFER